MIRKATDDEVSGATTSIMLMKEVNGTRVTGRFKYESEFTDNDRAKLESRDKWYFVNGETIHYFDMDDETQVLAKLQAD